MAVLLAEAAETPRVERHDAGDPDLEAEVPRRERPEAVAVTEEQDRLGFVGEVEEELVHAVRHLLG